MADTRSPPRAAPLMLTSRDRQGADGRATRPPACSRARLVHAPTPDRNVNGWPTPARPHAPPVMLTSRDRQGADGRATRPSACSRARLVVPDRNVSRNPLPTHNLRPTTPPAPNRLPSIHSPSFVDSTPFIRNPTPIPSLSVLASDRERRHDATTPTNIEIASPSAARPPQPSQIKSFTNLQNSHALFSKSVTRTPALP